MSSHTHVCMYACMYVHMIRTPVTDKVLRLNTACPLSRTGLEGMVHRDILHQADKEEIEAVCKVCKVGR